MDVAGSSMLTYLLTYLLTSGEMLSLLGPMPEGLINYKSHKWNNPCPVGGPCCLLRKRGSCAVDRKHVKHLHVPGCLKGQGNDAHARDKAEKY